MSDHGSYSSRSRSLPYAARDFRYGHADDISDSSKWRIPRKDSRFPPQNWANVPAPLPPSPPSTVLPYHPSQVQSSSLNRGRLSQPTTPPNRLPLGHRVLSAPMASHFSRIDYNNSGPASPTHAAPSYLSGATRSPSRPSSSSGGGVVVGPESRSRRSRRGSRSSPKTRAFFPWPPPGLLGKSIVSNEEALSLVANGALSFRGRAKKLPHTADGSAFRFYASVTMDGRRAVDTASNPDESLKDVSLSFMGLREGSEPEGSLEYPNMLYAFGKSPGTTTLTWFVGMRGQLRSPLDYSDSKAKKRKMKLISILERLKELEMGLDEDEDQYSYLYSNLIEDPERFTNPHHDRAFQIIDLFQVLMNKEWIDFSIPKNQVVAKFWDSPDDRVKTRFFHQLLLAVELHLRIQHAEHLDQNKRTLLQTLPPKVLWDLALAQRWLENVGIEQENLSSDDCEFQFQLHSKRRQKNALKHFARLLKWPNMEELEYALEERDRNSTPIEERSADTMCWFTGVILPGPTLPFVLMNSLIDCDQDTGEDLRYLTHVNPSCGFQYRANTYWSYKCVLGKVLGASRGVRQVSGWIGPCQFSPDLGRAQCVMLPTMAVPRSARQLTRHHVEHMDISSNPLGPDDLDDYYIRDFDVPSLPDATHDADDAIRMQKIAFLPRDEADDDGRGVGLERRRKAATCEAAVVFAVVGCNVPVRLRYDVDFICAPPCDGGPHPLFRGYRTRMVRVEDGLCDMAGWNGQFARDHGDNEYDYSNGRDANERAVTLALRGSGIRRASSAGVEGGVNSAAAYYEGDWFDDDYQDPYGYSNNSPQQQQLNHGARRRRSSLRRRQQQQLALPATPYSDEDNNDNDEDHRRHSFDEAPTLVVDASGVSDNEVFARAWCAHWGEHAVVANLKDTCVACAVREARAARVRVVLVTEGGREEERDRGVWDLLSTVG